MHKHNIEQAKYQEDYKIFLGFNDGLKGVVDLKKFIFNNDFSAFKRLQDKKQFKDFNLENHTLVWGNDLDLAPEFLYDLLLNSNKIN
jgi:uncharacterized protein YkvS